MIQGVVRGRLARFQAAGHNPPPAHSPTPWPKAMPFPPLGSVVMFPLVAMTALAGGCDRITGSLRGVGGATKEEALQIDLTVVAQEFKDNRSVALEKYVGKTLEVEVEHITVASEGVTRVILRLSPTAKPADSLSVVPECTFQFDDRRNEPFRGAKTGPFHAVVRGVLVSVRAENQQGDVNTLVMSPAWIERLN
jgi:hypothetical protein